MKRLGLLGLILGLLLSLVACSDDDEFVDVEGRTYETTCYTVSLYSEEVTYFIEYVTVDELKDNNLYYQMTFNAEGEFCVDSVVCGEWTQLGNEITVCSIDSVDTEFVVCGNKLVMDYCCEAGGTVLLEFTEL